MQVLNRALLAVLLLSALSCTVPIRQRVIAVDPTTLDHRARYLKAHLRNGDVFVLTDWAVDEQSKTLRGTGEHLGPNRDHIADGALSVPLDTIALFETNILARSPRIRALAIMTGVTAAVTVVCAFNTKACFGSCPTFYSDEGDTGAVLQAEGFSASLLPSLEATDTDALYHARPTQRTYPIRMTNEALETHVVRSVRLLAVPRAAGERVFSADGGVFWTATSLVAPAVCSAAEGDCRAAVESFDRRERFSLADPHNLARHESIDLRFPGAPTGAPLGLVIAARQTLLSTFLLYQSLAYLGHDASDVFASMERGGRSPDERAGGIGRLLGGIDVEVSDGQRWRTAGTFNENGPLATDVRIIPLPRGVSADHVRLRLNQGLWRVDYIALARLGRTVSPVALDPVTVVGPAGRVENAFREPLITMPGDSYTLSFQLPADFSNQELFIESRGYYLEWMRREWVAETSRMRAAMMFSAPRLAVRLLAPAFKKVEPDIEKQFWSSRYEIH